jgi:hypothetical protein
VANDISEQQGGYGLWTAPLAVTNLTAGTHTITAQYSDTNFTFTASAAQTVKVYGTPVGNLEQAVDATTSSATVSTGDPLFVGGWAADPTDGSPLTNVKIYIDGVVVGTPTLGGSRPDVAAATGNSAYANSGFSFTYPAGSLAIGTHTVTAVATNGGGVAVTLGSRTVTSAVVYAAPVGNLEQAVDAATGAATVPTSDTLFVGGWVADPVDGSPLVNVKVYIDGAAVGTPTLGGSRPDVATATGNPAYTNSGFSFSYSAGLLAAGPHTVTVVAVNSHGVVSTLAGKTITVAVVNRAPVGNLEQAVDPSTGSTSISASTGSLFAGGWAADYQDNSGAKQVQILIDGTPAGLATLGGSRPDVATYYGMPGWANAGYSFTGSVAGLTQGTHTVSAVATDSLGLSATVGSKVITVVP